MNQRTDDMYDLHDAALCEERQRQAVEAGLEFGRVMTKHMARVAREEAEEDNYEDAYEIYKRDEIYAMRGW